MAAEAIRVPEAVSDDPSLGPVRLDLSIGLVVRESTGPAPARPAGVPRTLPVPPPHGHPTPGRTR